MSDNRAEVALLNRPKIHLSARERRKMLSVPELNLGSVDAINYKTRGEREFLAKILYREDYLEAILRRNKYFIIGEKGTGKTSYAVFLNNADYNDTLSVMVNLTQTDYRRFIALLNKNDFLVSSYVDVWSMLIRLTPKHTIGSLAAETRCRHARRCLALRGSALSGFTARVPTPVS